MVDSVTRKPAWHVHPVAAEKSGYAIFVLKRLVLAGKLHRVGDVVIVAGRADLKVAAHLCATGAAKPADQRTALDVALLIELQRAERLQKVRQPQGGSKCNGATCGATQLAEGVETRVNASSAPDCEVMIDVISFHGVS